jgi:hypothetical protein
VKKISLQHAIERADDVHRPGFLRVQDYLAQDLDTNEILGPLGASWVPRYNDSQVRQIHFCVEWIVNNQVHPERLCILLSKGERRQSHTHR